MKNVAFYIVIFTAVAVLIGHDLFHVGTTHIEVKDVAQEVATSTVSMVAFGDMMLDRQVRLFINQNGTDYPFTKIAPILKGNDIVFANLEGSVTNNKSKTIDLSGKYLHFTFDPKMMPVLKSLGFNVVSLANNHTYDFLREGFAETQTHLDDAGISYFGDPYNSEGSLLTIVRNGIKIAFIGYHQFYDEDISPVIQQIESIKNDVDIVIVAPHWGIEYDTKPSKLQKEQAHAFIDAGADIVLGAHPHVIQPLEMYNGKPIFYSLGNFVFDQDFSYNTTHGLGVKFIFTTTADGVVTDVSLLPLSILKSVPMLAEEPDKTKIITSVLKDTEFTSSTSGVFQLLLK